MTSPESATTCPRRELAEFFEPDHGAIGNLSPITYILHTLSQRVFRRFPGIDTDYIASSILLGLLLYSCMVVVNISLTDESSIILVPQLLLTVFGILCIVISVRERRMGFSTLVRNLAKLMTDADEIVAMLDWLRSVFCLRIQAAFQLGSAAIIFFASFALVDRDDHGLRLSMSFSLSLMWLVASNLLYGGVMYPRLWNRMSQAAVELHWVRPDLTPCLREIASMATRLSMRSTLVAALSVIGINVFIGSVVSRYDVLLMLSATVMLVAIATFIGPHRQLRRMVIKGKHRSISDIEQMIAALRGSSATPDAATVDTIEKLAGLQRTISSGPNSMITLGSLTSLGASLTIPILTYASDLIGKRIADYLAG